MFPQPYEHSTYVHEHIMMDDIVVNQVAIVLCYVHEHTGQLHIVSSHLDVVECYVHEYTGDLLRVVCYVHVGLACLWLSQPLVMLALRCLDVVLLDKYRERLRLIVAVFYVHAVARCSVIDAR